VQQVFDGISICIICNNNEVHDFLGARCGLVVEALRYKLEGRGFDFRLCHWNFSLT
jgi:hypothetical protein